MKPLKELIKQMSYNRDRALGAEKDAYNICILYAENMLEKLETLKTNNKMKKEMKTKTEMKTIAQQLNIQEFPFEIKDKKGNLIYYENSKGSWEKREFDSKGNEIYFEDSNGYWVKREYDSNGNNIYVEYSNGRWYKQEYDSYRNPTLYENSNGYVENSGPKDEA